MNLGQVDRQVRMASTLNALLAFWLSGSSFTFNYVNRPGVTLNEIIVGAIVLVMSGIRIFNPSRFSWMGWVTVVLGAWLMVSPFLLANVTAYLPGILANDMLVGLGFVLCGA